MKNQEIKSEIKLSFGEGAAFFVNETEKTVVCVLSCKFKNVRSKRSQSFKVKGIARCSEGDEFNEKLGKIISESKAKKKAYNKASRIMKKRSEFYSKKAAEISFVTEKFEYLEEKEKMHFQQVMDSLD